MSEASACIAHPAGHARVLQAQVANIGLSCCQRPSVLLCGVGRTVVRYDQLEAAERLVFNRLYCLLKKAAPVRARSAYYDSESYGEGGTAGVRSVFVLAPEIDGYRFSDRSTNRVDSHNARAAVQGHVAGKSL